MQAKSLHIISFNIPYPANYGGIIDVFARIKNLHKAGVEIILHCFQYGRERADEVLGVYCKEVHYYERETGWKQQMSTLPYIVKTRQDKALLQRLLEDDCPILFEGTHSTYLIGEPLLKDRLKLVRMHNVEWKYYANLAKMETNILKKAYFQIEAKKLKSYELQTLKKHANVILSVSKVEQTYFIENGFEQVEYLSSSNPNDSVISQKGRGNYVLFHGDLSVIDNEKAAIWMLENIFSKIKTPFYIAGLNPSDFLKNKVKQFKNAQLFPSPTDEEMTKLIQEAHINLLYSFQSVGLKIKLLNALYQGRFVLGNDLIINIPALESLCSVFKNEEDAMTKIKQLLEQEFTLEQLQKRKKILEQAPFSNQSKAEQIVKLLGNDFLYNAFSKST